MLTQLSKDLWVAGYDHYMYSFVHFPTRMTVIRLSSGDVVLHSVIPIDDALARAIAARGSVTHIIAPNNMHHLYLGPAIARYANANVWGPAGLAQKRPDIAFHAALQPMTGPWSPDLEALPLRGSSLLEEWVFLHRPSRTLIVTDLVFNLTNVDNWASRCLFRAVGAFGQLAQSRLWRWSTRDPEAFRADVEAILTWDFERLVMAHGSIIETDAKAQLHAALTRAIPRLGAASSS